MIVGALAGGGGGGAASLALLAGALLVAPFGEGWLMDAFTGATLVVLRRDVAVGAGSSGAVGVAEARFAAIIDSFVVQTQKESRAVLRDKAFPIITVPARTRASAFVDRNLTALSHAVS